MKNKNNQFSVLLILCMALLTGCFPKIINQSKWQSETVTIDGKVSEWNLESMYYNDATKCLYSISNDNQNLYACFIFVDEQTQLKILQAGMEVWIDTLGKKKKYVGILFPLPSSRDMSIEEMRPQILGQRDKPNISTLKQKLLLGYKKMKLVGFTGVTDDIIPLQNIYDINVNMNWDETNRMVYEMTIPFKTFYKNSLSLPDSAKTFSLSLVIKALPMPQMGPGMQGGMPPSSMDRERMMPMRGNNGMLGGSMADGQDMFEEEFFNTKFKLTTR